MLITICVGGFITFCLGGFMVRYAQEGPLKTSRYVVEALGYGLAMVGLVSFIIGAIMLANEVMTR